MTTTQPQQGKVIPFGYAGNGGMARLRKLMQEEKAVIVDIRLAPFSKWQRDFNKRALQKQFGKRYIHMPELGNLHYQVQHRHLGIQLARQEQGIERLKKGLAKGYTIILMCACKNKACHRWTVISLLKEAFPDVEVSGEPQF